MIELITKYFPHLSVHQKDQFTQLFKLYEYWNTRINVISRKDFSLLYERHILHSLGIAKVIQFKPGTLVMDVGTGGGFPGIPLAILFPGVSFYLIDSIGKKIKVVKEVSTALNLQNVDASQKRAEEVNEKFHFIVSRAVTEFYPFYTWVKNKFLPESFNDLTNGILYLKGGDLTTELQEFAGKVSVFDLSTFFEEAFFETKKLVYLPM